jgi:hypothetical protein
LEKPDLSLRNKQPERLIRKLQDLKTFTKIWNKEQKVFQRLNLLSIEANIKKISENLSSDFNDQGAKDTLAFSLETERLAILKKEEQLWWMRSRALWLAEGDKNTRFFHNTASRNRIKKFIWEIEKEDGVLVKDQQGIKNRSYPLFQVFLQGSHPQ